MQSASRGVLGVKKSAGGWEPDWEDFTRKASQADLRENFFLCNPHNPTGRVWRPDELKRIIEICRPMISG
ncbi:aminotransferase class I/II-fold pyridoxal phosphate-dependent enzyme [Escherichia coli]|nr:aminotransferase class I/II-fold pyridoxal phosphate-dependent enzyme [Escherichia coli]